MLVIWVFLDIDPQTSAASSFAAMLRPARLRVDLAAAGPIVLFGFLFVTVSSRLTGEIGSSSNPISGMTIATLLLTCLIFCARLDRGTPYRCWRLSIAAVVCIAASNGGTTSQDLKTGFLSAPRPSGSNGLSSLVPSRSSLVIVAVLMAMNASNTDYSTKDLPPLQAANRHGIPGSLGQTSVCPDEILRLASPPKAIREGA